MSDDLLTKVRLKKFEIEAIQQCFAQFFLSKDHLWLFGSRADMTKRGGDIDLYIETNLPAADSYTAKVGFESALCNKIGDQKIDIVVHIMHDNFDLPIYAVAKSEGVQLI